MLHQCRAWRARCSCASQDRERGTEHARRAHQAPPRSRSDSGHAWPRSQRHNQHGLEVESSDFGGGPRVQQALTAGALDLAIGSGPELAMIAKGAPEIAVAALADAPYAVVLAVLNDGPKTVADLKGKKISVSTRGGLTYWLAQELSRRQGWGAEGFAITPLGATTAQTAALKTKQIDGMIVEVNAGYRLEEDKSGRVLVQFGDLIKTFHIYVLYAHKDFA